MEFQADGTIKQTLEIPPTLALLPIRDLVVFPYMVVPLMVSREMSVAAVDEALATKDRLVLLCAQRDESEDEPEADAIHRFGTVGMIMRMRKLSDGRIKVLVQGLMRARITSFAAAGALLHGRGRAGRRAAAAAGRARGRGAHARRARRPDQVLAGRQAAVARADDRHLRRRGSGAARRPGGVERHHEGRGRRRRCSEELDPLVRLRSVGALLQKEVEILEVQTTIQSRAKEEMSKAQREYFLREQLRQIQSELGGGSAKGDELEHAAAADRGGAHAGRGAQRGRSPAAPPGAGQPRLGRGGRPAHLPRVAGRGAVGDRHRRQARPGRGAPHPRRGPQRARGRQGSHPRAPRRAQADARARPRREGAHPLLRRTAGRGQDLARALDRARARTQVRAHVARRRARRGRDPRPPPHLRRRHAGARDPGAQAGGHGQPGLRPRRDRQARAPTSAATRRRRCSRCSIPSRTAPSATTTSASPTICRRRCSSPPPTRPIRFRARSAIAWRSSAWPATPRRRSWRSRGATCCRGSSWPRGSTTRRSRSAIRRCGSIITSYTREAGLRDLERQIARIARKVARQQVEDREAGKKTSKIMRDAGEAAEVPRAGAGAAPRPRGRTPTRSAPRRGWPGRPTAARCSRSRRSGCPARARSS